MYIDKIIKKESQPQDMPIEFITNTKLVINEEVSKKLGIDKLLDKSKCDLSDEQRLRVLLTHAIIHNPKLVIIDNTLEELCETNKNKFINYLISMKTNKAGGLVGSPALIIEG